MRKLNFAFLLAMFTFMGGGKSYAHDIEVANADGVTIYYNYTNDQTELAVTYKGSSPFNKDYADKVVIPESVPYEGKIYLVTSIGESAFRDCSGLKEVTIPKSVTSIGYSAFYDCSSLTEMTIPKSVTSIDSYPFTRCIGLEKIVVESGNPNYDSRENCNAIINTNTNELIAGCKNTIIPGSVTSIGFAAFYGCRSLTSVTIPNSVTSIGSSAFQNCSGLTELTIPNSVTSIGSSAFYGCDGLTELTIPGSVTSIRDQAFSGCSGLTSVTIPNSVTFIDNYVFCNCSGLTSVTIPNSVTSIGKYAFLYCSGLTKVTIGNSVTSIGNHAFSGCDGLTELTIPNSVTSIGESAFQRCSSLTELTIGNGVTSIGSGAFSYCSGLTTLYSLNTTPPSANTSTFDSNHYTNVDIFVPAEALESYKTADVWKDFQKLQGREGFAGETEKCAKPTIYYANNTLSFKCETEDATFKSTITDADIASYENSDIKLGVTYNISVYATKTGYEDSDVATAMLCWIDVNPKTEGITDDTASAVQQISATPVLIQAANGQVTVTGLTDGTTVAVYDLSGKQVGTATSKGGQVTISTGMTAGAAAIVKVGERSVKTVMK